MSVCIFDSIGSDSEGREGDESTSEDEEIEVTFFSLLLNKLLSIHQARDKAVRYKGIVIYVRIH